MESPRNDRNRLDEQYIINDLTAICNGLGKTDQNDGIYMKDRDCKLSLREIQRYLNADSSKHTARCLLGSLNIVRSDFIPLMIQYCDYNDGDQDLFNILLRLCANLTSSVSVLFENKDNDPIIEQEQLPLKKKMLTYLYTFKEAFGENEEIWKTLNTHIRHNEDDEITFERLIILVRNILHIPSDVYNDLSVQSDAHELCLDKMEKSGMLGTIIHLASETHKGTEFCFHLTEIIYFMLRDQNPKVLATSSPYTLKRKLDDTDADKQRYLELRARSQRERAQRDKKDYRAHYFRSSHFVVQNCRSLSEKSLLVHELIPKREQLDFDKGKVQVKKSKNKKPISSEDFMLHSDTNTKITKVTYYLKVFCTHFIEKVYNNYMQQIKHNLIQKKALDEDEAYYLWAIHFFISFATHMKLSYDHISETISSNTLHFIQMLITTYQDKLELEKKKFHELSKRLHLGLRAYREMLNFIKSIKPGMDHFDTVEKMKKNIFTELEYSTLLLNLFQQYNEPKFSHHFLRDLIKTNHIFLELYENAAPETAPHFLTRYSCPKVLIPHVMILKKFDQNDEATNVAVLKFLERIVFKCHNEVILFQASIFKCLIDIIENYSTSPLHEDFQKLGKHLFEKFGAMANRKSWMFQELLFWKTHSDIVEIENSVYPPSPPPPPPPGEEDLEQELQMNEDNRPKSQSLAALLEELADSGDENEQNLDNADTIEALKAHLADSSDEEVEPTVEAIKSLDDSGDKNEENPQKANTLEALREELAFLGDEMEENSTRASTLEALKEMLADSGDKSDANEEHTPLIVPTETRELD